MTAVDTGALSFFCSSRGKKRVQAMTSRLSYLNLMIKCPPLCMMRCGMEFSLSRSHFTVLTCVTCTPMLYMYLITAPPTSLFLQLNLIPSSILRPPPPLSLHVVSLGRPLLVDRVRGRRRPVADHAAPRAVRVVRDAADSGVVMVVVVVRSRGIDLLAVVVFLLGLGREAHLEAEIWMCIILQF